VNPQAQLCVAYGSRPLWTANAHTGSLDSCHACWLGGLTLRGDHVQPTPSFLRLCCDVEFADNTCTNCINAMSFSCVDYILVFLFQLSLDRNLTVPIPCSLDTCLGTWCMAKIRSRLVGSSCNLSNKILSVEFAKRFSNLWQWHVNWSDVIMCLFVTCICWKHLLFSSSLTIFVFLG
jgi:hypothetical protein